MVSHTTRLACYAIPHLSIYLDALTRHNFDAACAQRTCRKLRASHSLVLRAPSEAVQGRASQGRASQGRAILLGAHLLALEDHRDPNADQEAGHSTPDGDADSGPGAQSVAPIVSCDRSRGSRRRRRDQDELRGSHDLLDSDGVGGRAEEGRGDGLVGELGGDGGERRVRGGFALHADREIDFDAAGGGGGLHRVQRHGRLVSHLLADRGKHCRCKVRDGPSNGHGHLHGVRRGRRCVRRGRRRRRRIVAVRRGACKRWVCLEPAKHSLDLEVLRIDDIADQRVGPRHVLVLHNRSWIVADAVVLGERLGHGHCILVVRDHLACERGELGGSSRHVDGHVVVHLAVDGLETLLELAVRASAAEKVAVGTHRVRGGSERLVRATLLVIRVHCLLLSRHDAGVDGLRRRLGHAPQVSGGDDRLRGGARARHLDLG
eukprot:scaffold31352_cov68-Phaeocystis_antarctica.AAC.4